MINYLATYSDNCHQDIDCIGSNDSKRNVSTLHFCIFEYALRIEENLKDTEIQEWNSLTNDTLIKIKRTKAVKKSNSYIMEGA